MSKITTSLKAIMVMGVFLMLYACGGGSNSNSTSGNGLIVVGSTSSFVSLSFPGNNTTLQSGTSTTVSALLKNSDGTLVADGTAVTFTTTLGSLTPADGKTTTTNGTASVSLSPGTNSGQGQITASAIINNRQASSSTLFTIVPPALKLEAITLPGYPSGGMTYGASQNVSVKVTKLDGSLFNQSVEVVFSSVQAATGKATITSPVMTDSKGIASTTYTAITATGTDTITASIAGSTQQQTITINPLDAGAISYVSSSPTNIGLKGMGGLGIQETSKVTFKVVDTSGAPKANQLVTFALNTNVGGLALSTYTGSTAADGTVSTIVQAGIVATPVRVTASTEVGTPPITISTQSDQLVVSTGVPAQDGFSVSIANLSPECWNVDGVTSKVTARLSDHFHNPVPDGTAVYFTTSGGVIQSSCTTTGGACSVNWTSQNPRPIMPLSPTGLPSTGASKDGRSVILAYAVGEEAFVDQNGNGVADSGEFTDTSEAFRDDNENNTKDINETFIDFNNDKTFNGPDGKYNGVLQGSAYVGAAKSKYVFSNSAIVMATSSATITTTCGAVPLGTTSSCSVTVNDDNGNTMPTGTTVEFKLTTLQPGTTVTGSGTTSTGLSMPAYDKYIFPNSSANVGVKFPVSISDPNKTTSATGVLEVKVTSPGGVVTTGVKQIN
jgi:hypothetical protein